LYFIANAAYVNMYIRRRLFGKAAFEVCNHRDKDKKGRSSANT
jgi:hypothetical protein